MCNGVICLSPRNVSFQGCGEGQITHSLVPSASHRKNGTVPVSQLIYHAGLPTNAAGWRGRSPPLAAAAKIGYGLAMSRYEYHPPNWPDNHSFAVGWDPALETFFAQVMDHSISRNDDCVILWVGGPPPHYSDVDEMMGAVNSRIKGQSEHITLTQAMRKRLIRDKEKHGNAKTAKDRRKRPLCGWTFCPGSDRIRPCK
jgi:hypothetical protein